MKYNRRNCRCATRGTVLFLEESTAQGLYELWYAVKAMGGAIAVPLVPLKVRFIHTTLQYAVLVLCMYYSTSPGRVMLNGILRHRGICAIYVIISVYYIFFNWPNAQLAFLFFEGLCGLRYPGSSSRKIFLLYNTAAQANSKNSKTVLKSSRA